MTKKNEVISNAQGSAIEVITPAQLAMTLPEDTKPREFAVWIRALQQNWRQGTVAVKGRSDVAFSNKKPWKQKGTGRARAGSAKSPLWRKGGIIFGPQPRTRTLSIPQQVKYRVLNKMMWDLLSDKNVLCLDWERQTPKTSHAYAVLKDANLHRERINLVVRSDDLITQASFVNIPNVNILLFDQVNAVDLATGTKVIFLKKDFDNFKEMVLRWI